MHIIENNKKQQTQKQYTKHKIANQFVVGTQAMLPNETFTL
jgi:hypothetical protein